MRRAVRQPELAPAVRARVCGPPGAAGPGRSWTSSSRARGRGEQRVSLGVALIGCVASSDTGRIVGIQLGPSVQRWVSS
ncbi:hypothetical protein Micbo1qcDRAFT_163137 [Microdochium bolleyi]|uniref:Uncharacterized protein n=1 Tax=Microdochium bolleyi TaxID=196109 RepID=A0A136J2D8_9PEZI|nr:hypothetical protein Micbo1qcDRAFT_163137 [Microdochium bolleyi]